MAERRKVQKLVTVTKLSLVFLFFLAVPAYPGSNDVFFEDFDDKVEGTTVDLRSQMPTDIRTSNDIVDWWINRILGRPMNTEDRQQIVDFMSQGRNPDYDLPQDQIDDRLPRMVELIFLSPDFQWR